MFNSSKKYQFPIQSSKFYNIENNEKILKILSTYKTEKKYKIIVNPLGTYIKYRKKRNDYLQLYNQNKFYYYSKLMTKLMGKFVKKKLPNEFKTMVLNCFVWYFIGNTGILSKIGKCLKK